MTDFRELLGTEAWNHAMEVAINNEGDFSVTPFLQSLVDQGVLKVEVRTHLVSDIRETRLVSSWRTVEPTEVPSE